VLPGPPVAPPLTDGQAYQAPSRLSLLGWHLWTFDRVSYLCETCPRKELASERIRLATEYPSDLQ